MYHFKRIPVTIFLTLALSGCGGGSDEGKSDSGAQPPPAPTTVYIWVADDTSDSDGAYFTGPAVANAFCAAAVTSQSVTFSTPVNTHWGLLAFPTSEPADFFSTNPVVQRPDGTAIVADYAGFFDEGVRLTNPVSPSSATIQVWTGIEWTTGRYAGNSNSCQGWTSDSNSDTGMRGSANLRSQNSHLDSSPGSCANTHGIYCVSFQN